MIEKLQSLVNYFIPASFQDKEFSNRLLRARVLIIMLLWGLLSTGSVLLVVLLSSYYTSENKQLTSVIILVILSAYLYSLYSFKRTGGLILSANIYMLSAYLGIASSGFFTGGLVSATTTHLLFILPVFAFLIAGRGWGILWTTLVSLTVVAFYIFYLQGVRFDNVVSADVRVGTYVAMWMFAMGLIASCLYVYEVQLKNLNQVLKEKSKQYAYDSLHDPLTGLSNRKLFERRAKEAIDFAISGNVKAAIIYIDLDDFKPVNDSYGHHVGDEALRIVAGRLTHGVRSSDTVARLGGDEFAVLLHGAKDVETIAVLANKLLLSLREVMIIDQQAIELSASLGVVRIPDDSSQLDQALRLADRTMYQAKTVKNRVCFYGE